MMGQRGAHRLTPGRPLRREAHALVGVHWTLPCAQAQMHLVTERRRLLYIEPTMTSVCAQEVVMMHGCADSYRHAWAFPSAHAGDAPEAVPEQRARANGSGRSARERASEQRSARLHCAPNVSEREERAAGGRAHTSRRRPSTIPSSICVCVLPCPCPTQTLPCASPTPNCAPLRIPRPRSVLTACPPR